MLQCGHWGLEREVSLIYSLNRPTLIFCNVKIWFHIPKIGRGMDRKQSRITRWGPQNNRRGLERGLTLGYWPLWANFVKKVFWSEDSFYEKHGTNCRIQNGRQRAPKWPTGSGKGSNPRLLATPNNFHWIGFLIRGFLLWETWNRLQNPKWPPEGPKMADGV